MTVEELEAKLTSKFPKVEKDKVPVKDYPTFRLPGTDELRPVMRWLKNEAGFDYFHMVTGVDYKGELNLAGYIREPNHNIFLEGAPAPQTAPPRLTADYPYREKIEIVYALISLKDRLTVFLKLDVPRDGGRLPSLIREFKSVDWQEREIFDLMGVKFEGHPNLKKILTPDFIEGHPLRKDYVHKKDRFDQ